MNRFEIQEVLSERVAKLFEGLDVEECRKALEELIDDYILGTAGFTVMSEVRKVKLASGGKAVSFQPLANGRAMLISAYGFKVKSQSECKCGRAFLVLDELTQDDHEKARE